jgi:hypothetical protein
MNFTQFTVAPFLALLIKMWEQMRTTSLFPSLSLHEDWNGTDILLAFAYQGKEGYLLCLHSL